LRESIGKKGEDNKREGRGKRRGKAKWEWKEGPHKILTPRKVLDFLLKNTGPGKS